MNDFLESSQLPPVLTPAQAAKYLQVSKDTVLRLFHSRELVGSQFGKVVRLDRESVIAWARGKPSNAQGVKR